LRVIDLSMVIQPHWRWPIKPELKMDHGRGDPFQVTLVNLSMHAFTHVDTPLHIEPGRITIDQVPADKLVGPAAVIDLTSVGANQAITAAQLKERCPALEAGDMVVLKTGWDLKRDYTSREYWLEAPYVEAEAAAWLAGQPIKAVAFDFPQDQAIREIPKRHPPAEEMPTHGIILRRGIYLIEYLCNVHRIEAGRVTLVAAPLKVLGAEGAPARVIALVD